MLSSAIIVFREVFEIVLILGIVLAATKNIPGRMKAIVAGLAAGVIGAGIVALFIEKISQFAEGLGQEYFNAGVLFVAAGFIGWTVLWMKKHARHLKKDFQDLGQAVAQGKTPIIALSAVIALAILREGSEIVLFVYGMIAAGEPAGALLVGSLIGMTGGVIIGLLLYFGLIRLSVKIFFQVTSLLLVLLVAGMTSKAFGFLVQAGIFESLANVAWDSSALLNEHSLIGESLGTLVGYTARPTFIQIIAYLLTLTTLLTVMKMIDKNISLSNLFQRAPAALILLALFAPKPSYATENVTSPYVVKGELEAKWKGGYVFDDDEEDGAWKQKATLEYGLTDKAQIEGEAEIENEGDDDDTDLTAFALEGKYEFFEAGEYFLDVALKGEYEFNLQDGPDKIEAKLILAKDVGQFHHRANLIVEREVGDDAEDETEAGFAWSSRYKYKKEFEPGIEYYAEFGPISDPEDFEDQEHLLGPAAYGKIGNFKYDVGYLFGVSDGAPDGTLKAILAYEWYF